MKSIKPNERKESEAYVIQCVQCNTKSEYSKDSPTKMMRKEIKTTKVKGIFFFQNVCVSVCMYVFCV